LERILNFEDVYSAVTEVKKVHLVWLSIFFLMMVSSCSFVKSTEQLDLINISSLL
jgi:hypothetical protein